MASCLTLVAALVRIRRKRTEAYFITQCAEPGGATRHRDSCQLTCRFDEDVVEA